MDPYTVKWFERLGVDEDDRLDIVRRFGLPPQCAARRGKWFAAVGSHIASTREGVRFTEIAHQNI